MISLTILSLVTSVKDYVEITHKLIEFEPLKNYTELGALFTYLIVSLGNVIKDFFSFSIFKNAWSIPIIIPDIASAMISEISVLDGYFQSAFTFLETNLNNGGNSVSSSFSLNPGILVLEKLFIGLINSFFLFLPTSTSHLITLRRFVMQGIEAGYISGLGTLAGNLLWLASIILGWRFFVIPWLSFDIFRYVLGFILIVKYIWDSSKERRMALEDLSKWKIFLLNFLLALTEQTCIYPFISNLSFGPEASILEGFPADNYASFLTIHGAYLLGIFIGSFSLLLFACWFWENPAFSIYIWITTKSSNKISTSSYYKILNFSFLYGTMLCAIASIPYYGLDYTITNPIGLVPQDRILEQKKSQSDPDRLITETAFLGVNPTDKNARIRDGVHARRERWKQRLIKYQSYDAAVYDQGIYDFLTIEDLNYGFDRFWLRRKMRNHQIRFRLFPGPWMRSLKKQLNKPAISTKERNNKESNQPPSAIGPRIEFFRILFEQYYHPNFHDRTQSSAIALNLKQRGSAFIPFLPGGELRSNLLEKLVISEGDTLGGPSPITGQLISSDLISKGLKREKRAPLNKLILNSTSKQLKRGLIYEHSALRKFVRNFNTRTNLNLAFGPQRGLANQGSSSKEVNNNLTIPSTETRSLNKTGLTSRINHPTIYSKRWKSIFSKMQPFTKTSNYSSYFLFRNVSKQITIPQNQKSLKLNFINQKYYNKDLLILAKLKALLTPQRGASASPFLPEQGDYLLVSEGKLRSNPPFGDSLTLLRPLSFYLQKEQAFKRKLRYYGATTMRKLTIGNQAPYLKTLMKRGFYYYKPSLRLKKTLYVASMRRGFRKKSRKQKNIAFSANLNQANNDVSKNNAQTNQNTPSLASLPSALPGGQLRSSLRSKLRPWDANTELSSNKASYSVLNKRASRYRHQIYKDVLQHWYYTPFNRLALKFDIDAFINRQPKAHYLSKNEERMLHVKRFLLSEHYDTLRWYTYMQHYRTMKTNIGGTKSFANRIYNQQFQGTFKKIRHLFAITPSQSYLAPPIGTVNNSRLTNDGNNRFKTSSVEALADFSILKFDQPLYNDNHLTDIKSIYLHEELLTGKTPPTSQEPLQAQRGVSSFLPAPSGAAFIANDILTVYPPEGGVKGKKAKASVEGKVQSTGNLSISQEDKSAFFASELLINPFSNQTIRNELSLDLINQSKDLIGKQFLLGISNNNTNGEDLLNIGGNNDPYGVTINKAVPLGGPKGEKENTRLIYSELLVKLIKECKRYIYDQSSLKNYITHRIEKREQRNQEQTRELNKRLEKLKNWLNFQTSKDRFKTTQVKRDEKALLTTGMQKALNDSIFISEDLNPLYSNKPLLKTKASLYKNKLSDISSVMDNSYIKTEERIKAKMMILKTAETLASGGRLDNKLSTQLTHLGNTINSCKNVLKTQIQLIKIRTNKNLEWWRKKQRVITKRKNSRKRDRFKKEIAGVNANIEKLVKKAKTEKYNLYKTLYGNSNKNEISSHLLYSSTEGSRISLSNPLPPQGGGFPVRDEGRDVTFIKTADSSLLRKKRESENKENGGLMHSIWQKFFTKKYRKKQSSKGRRYKSFSYGRYLTATRKPKLIGTGISPNNSLNEWKSNQLSARTDADITPFYSPSKGVSPSGELELLMAKIDSISGANGFIINKNEKQEFLKLEKINAENLLKYNQTQYLSVNDFKKSLKKSQINKRSRHTWRKYKRHKFNTAQSKYRKRRIQSRGKLRVMSKKLKKLSATHELRLWWWNSFLPRYFSNINLNNSLVGLSKVDKKNATIKTTGAFDTDFKPLSKVDLKVRSVINEPLPPKGGPLPDFLSESNYYPPAALSSPFYPNLYPPGGGVEEFPSQGSGKKGKGPREGGGGRDRLGSDGIKLETAFNETNPLTTVKTKNLDIMTTNLPFYAGWDESLRKFVITNRLLSRRDAGQISKYNSGLLLTERSSAKAPKGGKESEGASKSSVTTNHQNLQFTNSPIQGLNEGTFLYLQTDMPFNSYNIDQFIPSNQSFYAPLGWRRFEFRHSVLKTWYNKINNQLNSNDNQYQNPLRGYQNGEVSSNLILSVKNVRKILNSSSSIQKNNRQNLKFKRAIARRIKKRYKLLKQTPNQLMYTPTGPLLTEVLPSHYISVFDQQYRFPRNRYLKRNLLKTTKKTTLLAMLDASNAQSNQVNSNGFSAFTKSVQYDFKAFTLRKRVKPRRKYHRKRFIKKDGLIFPRRTKFTKTEFSNSSERWRPSSRIKQKSSLVDRSKPKSNKRVKTNPLRLRQLRRREFQQTIKPSQRYQPRNGGFTWPGDYLRLEALEMPKFKRDSFIKTTSTEGNETQPNEGINIIAKKPNQKINAQPVGIMPRKYLIEKHNILVLKKKLEKAHASHKLTQALKEYKLLTQK